MLRGKVWGSTEAFRLDSPFVDVHWLEIDPNKQCSLHRHDHKWNAFIVFSGTLEIEVHKNDYDLVDTTILGPGQFTTVRPGEYHRFRSVGEKVTALEIYYPPMLAEDIFRKDVGGGRNDPA